MVTKLGILGGTFDPVHFGHLLMAKDAMIQHNLDKVVFIPTNHSPLKKNLPNASNYHRLNMLDLATNEIDKFHISDFETKRKGVSYSVDTVKYFKKKGRGDTEAYFILGADSFISMDRWKDPKTLFELSKFCVFQRKPAENEVGALLTGDWVNAFLRRLIKQENNERVFILDQVAKISSSNIRDRIIQGKDISVLVPRLVEEYILRHRLYCND